jgi:hypothetical protein
VCLMMGSDLDESDLDVGIEMPETRKRNRRSAETW